MIPKKNFARPFNIQLNCKKGTLVNVNIKSMVKDPEVHAIEPCLRENIERGCKGKTILIYSDSQAALQALACNKIKSKLIWNCLETQQTLGNQNKVTLKWVPGHKGVEGNEEAHPCEKGLRNSIIGSEPMCGIPKSSVELFAIPAYACANSGIGYQTALALALRRCKIIMADKECQMESKNKIVKETCNENIVIKYLDLASLASVRCFATEIIQSEEKLDILVNNAGIFCMKNEKTKDVLNDVMQVNHISPFLLTNLLIELLKQPEGGRVIFVSSIGAFFHKLSLETLKDPLETIPTTLSAAINYYNSKLYNMITSKVLAEKLRDTNVTSNCLHPGMINTDFLTRNSSYVGFMFPILKTITSSIIKCSTKDVVDAAALTVFLTTSETVRYTSGKFFVNYQEHVYPRVLEDEVFCQSIWDERKLKDLRHTVGISTS
ncbi:hypothetical protein NQ317_001622 [Molorchus minor]|uniref:RNase H type-1 domain-containing protein n=1 Tax=Molorchus minor TaxID=1323400 RepID=A0ABQ9JQ98_9CUCU|nr:hypothetical protein NQ317_001622 [Molorchus minor]